jgi:predicted DNA-binding protein YlxM (UPF0122 family)
MSSNVKKWGVVAGMALLAAAVLFAGGIVGGIITGVIPVQAEDDNPWPWPGHGRGWGGPREVLETVAEVLGLAPEDLRSEIQGGKSVAEVAEAQGVDTQSIVDAINAEIEQWVQEAVNEGRLTQEQADRIRESLADFDGERLLGLAMPFGPLHGGFGRGWGGAQAIMETAAEVLGLAPEDLRSELEGGKTLGDVAEAEGVETQAIVDAVHAQVTEMLQEAVESGRLTQEQADRMLERLAECDGAQFRCLGMPFGPGPGRRGDFGIGGAWGGPWGGLDAAAEVLGLEPEDLMAELRDGKTLTEIAEERGVDPQAVQDVMVEQMEQILQQAEEDGSLSPECADCARQRFEDCQGNWLQPKGGFFGGMRRGGRGSWGGFGHWAPSTE